jgi:hypothetical protein
MIDHGAVELGLVRDGSPLVEFVADLRLLRARQPFRPIATRDNVRTMITEAEWNRYCPGLSYRPPCPAVTRSA